MAIKAGKTKLKKSISEQRKKLQAKRDSEGHKKLKAYKYSIETYLAKVDLCVKEGGKSMDCKLKIRDEMQEIEKEKKAKPKKK